ncbi:uncharacterized protein LOC135834139 [Planococcus citri]|uniref:uncharacterized protein LOC135834139 n=1 Tax=Planococcus citri TaxID=170843 RepID=UPI0031F9D80C
MEDQDGTFSYVHSSRYSGRCIVKLIETLKKLIANNYSIDNVSEVRVNLEELTKEFEWYKRISSRGFNLASVSKDAAKPKTDEEVSALEDKILAELEKVNKAVLPVIAKSKSYISEFEAQQTRESLNNSSMNMTGGFPEPNVKLPRIDIPKFDGVAIENFLEFYAIFQNVVHEEPTLSKVKKLYYLKLALIGEAHDLVKDTPVTDKGYDEAWCLVVSTYKDIKSITRRHFDQLFSINRIKSTSEIPMLLSNVNRALKGLRACGEDTENWGPILSYIVSEKLDNVTYEDFEKSLTTNTKFPRWSVLKTFLENRASVTKRSSDLTKQTKRNDTPPSSSGKRSTLTAVSNNETRSGPSGTPQSSPPKPACSCCDKLHLLIDCNVFRDKTPKQRYEIIKSKSLCGNCFHSNHRTNECRKQPNCKKCSNRHHTLLHFDKTNDPKDPPKPELNEDGTPRTTCGMSSLVSVQKPIALLPSALVKFVSGNKCGTMRVLLDSCSQLNLITNEFIKRNDLSTTKAPYPSKVAGIGDSETECNQIIEFSIESRVEDFEFCARFTVINNRIPYSVTNYIIGDFAEKVNERRLNLADTAFYDRNVNINSIDAILGVEAYNLCVRNKTIFIESACLRDTVFGWTISSSIESARNTRHSQPYCGLTIDNIDQRLERFWKIDSYPDSAPKSTEHEECQKHFMRTYQRAPDGRFIVQLPFKEDPSVITGNFGIAVKYLKRMESKLDETTKRMYTDFMILHPTSRCVTSIEYNYEVTFSGKSLNDVLMVGPTIQPELNDTLLCFRIFCKVISADIQHMYRCIEILKAHRRFQSIIWRGKRHELNTITYGTAPAAYEATQCLDILAEEVKVTRPRTSIAIRKGFYMDDWLYGADTDEELIELQQSVHETLLSAGFKLRKYQSNSNEVLAKIDPALIEHNLTVQFGDNEALSILGLAWCPSTDSFALKTDVPAPTSTVTKRQMLSTISKVFDPLGLACPVTIRGKLLFKRLWKLGISWDDPVTPEIDSLFNAYLSDLNRLSKFVIPRYVRDFDSNTETIVGFCDASEQAYCAAVYAFNAKRLQLLCSKTRVAPEKELNILQLELQAAVLLVQLIQRVSKILNVDIHRSKLFTDSTIVLAWLSKPASEWKTFVRNRVVKITEVFPIQHWSHVRSGENPADLATRGISTESLLQSSMWLSGPEFVINLDNSSNNTEIDETICEPYRRKTKIASFIAADLETNLKKHSKLISSCESYEKLRFMYAAAIAVIRHWKSRILK